MSKRRKASLIPDKMTLGEAEELRRTDDDLNFRQSILSEGEFMGIVLPEREWVLKDLVVEESMTIVNGHRGGGKSWFAMVLANAVTWGESMGPWAAPKARDVLLIDGEMPLSILQERFAELNEGRDIKDKRGRLWIYPEAYAYRIGLKRANILEPVWRKRVSEYVRELGVQVLILDNLSSLAPGIDENDKTPFDPVNRWLLELRFNGVTIIMTHHTGKSGDQRGTSAHEDHVDTAIMLERPGGMGADTGCAFTVWASKDRAFIMQGQRFTIRLEKVGKGMKFVEMKDSSKRVAASLINSGCGVKEAERMGISTRTYYRAQKEMRGVSEGAGEGQRGVSRGVRERQYK